MSHPSPLGFRQIGTFLLYLVFTAFTLGFVSTLLPSGAATLLQTLVGPVAAFTAALAIGQKATRAGSPVPPRPDRIRFAFQATTAIFGVFGLALAFLLFLSGGGLRGLPLSDLMIGFPVVFLVTALTSYFGLTVGFRAARPSPM